MSDFFSEEATLTTVWQSEGDSIPKITTYSISEFVAQTKDGPDSQPIFEEKPVSIETRMRNGLASAWVRYEAKFGTQEELIEWSGYDLFSFIEHQNEWKIVSITYLALE